MLLGKHILNGSSGPSIPIGEKWTFTSNGSWEAPAKGKYKITLVGAGGKGGDGGKAYSKNCKNTRCGGSGGGGGGAGQTVINTVTFKLGDTINIAIGISSGTASNITGSATIKANGGNSGGSGVSTHVGWGGACSDISGGAVGANYGTGGSSGGRNYSPSGRGCADCFGSYGGSGKVSDYGNGYGTGGAGGKGANNNDNTAIPSGCTNDYYWYPPDGSGPGKPGTQGICVIEYLGR